jgi:hypothetical protein
MDNDMRRYIDQELAKLYAEKRALIQRLNSHIWNEYWIVLVAIQTPPSPL